MKKAVISSGGKQYLVAEGETLSVDYLGTKAKTIDFDCLLTLDGESIKIGQPTLKEAKVTAEILEPEVKADKVVAIRFKAKKRVHKTRGHRQLLTTIKITKIV